VSKENVPSTTLPSTSPKSEENWFSVERSTPNTPAVQEGSALDRVVTAVQNSPNCCIDKDQNSTLQGEATRTPAKGTPVRGFKERNNELRRVIHSPQLAEQTRGGIPSYRLAERHTR